MADWQAVEAVIFDLGGTLLHYHTYGEPNFRKVTLRGLANLRDGLPEYGFEPPAQEIFGETIDRHIREAYMASLEDLLGGTTIEDPVRAALAEMGFTPDVAQWADLRARFYAVIDEIVELRVGVVDTLTTLQTEGYKLGLVSNTYWGRDLHDRHLAQYGLLDLLPERIYSSEQPHTKPHPSIFETMLARLGVVAERAVYVGDLLKADVGGAQGAGLRAVLITAPFAAEHNAEEKDNFTPDAAINEIPELLDVLREWR